jgi:dihydroorotase
MYEKILVQGGRLLDPAQGLDRIASLAVANGKVVGYDLPASDFAPEQIVDATHQWVIPGIVDLATRLREPGAEFKAVLESELSAAIAGGVTSVVCLPDTDPALDEPGLVKMLKFKTRGLNLARVFPLGALTVSLKGEVITEMAELTEAGCIGFSQADQALFDTQVLLRAMQYAKSFGFRIWLQPTDPYLSRGGVAHSGPVATRLGLSGISSSAEVIALHTLIELVKTTGCAVHLCRLSTAAGIQLVREAKAQGLPVTADVSIYHTLLTDTDIGFFDSNYRVTPPLRTQRDRDAILVGLSDGTIDAICSDHTPVDDDAKLLPFAEAEAGLTGLELILPLALKLVEQKQLSLTRAITCLTQGPAAVLSSTGNPLKSPLGSLAVGAPADIAIVDPKRRWVASRTILQSQGKHTPYANQELHGRATTVLVDGVLKSMAALN